VFKKGGAKALEKGNMLLYQEALPSSADRRGGGKKGKIEKRGKSKGNKMERESPFIVKEKKITSARDATPCPFENPLPF